MTISHLEVVAALNQIFHRVLQQQLARELVVLDDCSDEVAFMLQHAATDFCFTDLGGVHNKVLGAMCPLPSYLLPTPFVPT